jgi:hypothetical protein
MTTDCQRRSAAAASKSDFAMVTLVLKVLAKGRQLRIQSTVSGSIDRRNVHGYEP